MVLMFFLSKFTGIENSQLGLGLTGFILLTVNLIPLIFISSGISLGVGLFANSFKEANSYFTPVIFLFMIPAYIANTSSVELNIVSAVIPIVNTTLLIRSVLVNDINLNLFAVTLVVNGLFAVMSLVFMVKVFGTEKIIFGSGKELDITLNRKKIKEKTYLDSDDTLLALALIIVLYIYSSLLLPSFTDIYFITLFTQYGLFALLPICILWYGKADLKKSLGITLPKFKWVVYSTIIYLGAFSIIIIYQFFISKYIDYSPTLVELENFFSGLTPGKKFLLIALTPGICEEILFRGFALKPLQKNLGSKWSIIITGIIFSIIHLDILRLFPTLLLGLAFGYIAVKSGSILLPIIFHIINNSLAIFWPENFQNQLVFLVPIATIFLLLSLKIIVKYYKTS
jgi:sodium transport system permease protein